tara:strand:- start:8055 stop:8471 length:417 start_codon:yes stop_codon:yes gene_type:complete
MKKRKYGRKTTRVPRKTNTDRLNDCKSWQEVTSCPLYDDWIKTIPFKSYLYHPSMSVHDELENRESRIRYETMCDSIDSILTKEERDIFYGIAEQDKSLRVIASEKECSYERIRQIFIRCQKKIRNNEEIKRIQPEAY